MVAAMALMASSAAYAQTTLPEIHMYFTVGNAASLAGPNAGGATTTPLDWTTNPDITAAPGSDVILNVWIRALAGDTPGGATHIDSYNYEITGQGALASFQAGGRRQRDLGSPYVPDVPAAGAGSDFSDLPGVDSQLFGVSGGNSAAGTIVPGSGDSNGAWLVQVISVHVSATAAPGDALSLYLTTPLTNASKFSTGGIGSLTTTAFGATPTGGLDQKRASVPTQDILGSLNNRVSTTADAVIRVVPEPGTLGLLALGLLGLRRRRSC
jgi:hypothetical protein